ncbi:MAG: hypothetical protein PV344_05240, partial [Anaplasma sp.]|nr:hypothetical protein [Anaplasma sp.]
CLCLLVFFNKTNQLLVGARPVRFSRFICVVAQLQYEYCKRLNFRENLIFANLLLFAKNRSRIQFRHYVNTMEATFDLLKLGPANNFIFLALAQFTKI